MRNETARASVLSSTLTINEYAPAEVPASPRPRLTSVSSRFMGGRQWVAGIVVLVTLGVMLWLFNRMRREG